MFCKKLGIELDSFSYVKEMNFFDYVWENIGKEGDTILDDFRKKFGSIGILKPSAVAYSPKRKKDYYALDAENISDYECYWEAIKSSLKEGKDCLFDLVKNRKMVFNPNVEY